MKRLFPLLLALVLAVFFVCMGPLSAKQECKPLKVIAPDLIVESFEFGKFPDGFRPGQVSNKKVKFIPTNIVKGRGFSYGYRLKLNTKRKEVHWYHQIGFSKGRNHLVPVKDGLIYFDWDVVDGYGKGKHKVKGWIEDKELPTLYYTVK